MRMDRETEALLYWVSKSKSRSLSALTPEAARNEYRRTLAKTDMDPAPVSSVFDFNIPSSGGELMLRGYIPSSGNISAKRMQKCPYRCYPGVLFFHGGGCVLGDLNTHDVLCRTLCNDAQAIVVSVDYRLAPEHRFPAAVEDAVASLKWLSLNAEDLGIDPERIAIAGDSAGGGLAAVAVHECKNDVNLSLRAQVLIYPALDLRARLPSCQMFADVFPIPTDLITWFHNHYFGSAWPCDDPRAMPLLYGDYERLPSTLIIAAGIDSLRDEAAEYAEKLIAAGVPVEYICEEGTVHGFMNMARILRQAYHRSRSKISDFLIERLRRATASQSASVIDLQVRRGEARYS